MFDPALVSARVCCKRLETGPRLIGFRGYQARVSGVLAFRANRPGIGLDFGQPRVAGGNRYRRRNNWRDLPVAGRRARNIRHGIGKGKFDFRWKAFLVCFLRASWPARESFC